MQALTRRSSLLLDLAIDLVMPPLGTLAIYTSLGLAGSVAFHGGATAIGSFACVAFVIALYVARGWQLSNTGARGLVDLLRVPLYLFWKLGLAFRRPSAWVRTARGGESP